LQLLQWGIVQPSELQWIDPPPTAAFNQACDLLEKLGAVERKVATENNVMTIPHYRITLQGESISRLGAHPRLAHMMVRGAELGVAKMACDIAALLTERNPLRSDQADITDSLRALKNGDNRFKRIKQQSKQFQSTVRQHTNGMATNAADIDYWPGLLLAMAYPDRIAQQRRPNGTQFVLSNGRAAVLQEHDNLRASQFLAIADLGGNKQREDRIFMAAAIDARCFDDELADQVTEKTTADWDEKTGRFIAEQQRCVGALVLESKTVTKIDSSIRSPSILAMIRKRGLSVLAFDEGLQQWLARIALMASLEQGWPDLSEEALLSTLESWLTPYLDKVNTLAQLKSLDFKTMLTTLLPWEQQQRLNKQLPEKITIPTCEGARIDYQQSPPVLAVRLQEMFGCASSPTVADGRVTLLCHLLSPARRPLAVTQDLTSFWANAYQDVKKDMKGRYPKHPWPDDPINAPPTNRAKPRKR
jgi:ATP-dependent helicase HrpB